MTANVDSDIMTAGEIRTQLDSTTGSREELSFFALGQPMLDEYCRHWLNRDAEQARLSPRYRVYYKVRSFLPPLVRHWLQRGNRPNVAANWHLPEEFFSGLRQRVLDNQQDATFIHPWPHQSDFALVLTHDVESKHGMRRIMEIADIEERLGFRSSWNLVPYKYGIDQGIVRELVSRSCEIGVHGYNHDGKLFTSKKEFDRRVPYINDALRSYDAVGFRAPMVHRNLQWMQSLDVEYDASCFDTDPFQPMPGGIGSVWPVSIGKFVELPYTLAQDHTLFIVLGSRDGRIWEEKADFLVRCNGMVLTLTHPDYLTSKRTLQLYRDFLLRMRDTSGAWHALPKEVAKWWRQREQSSIVTDIQGNSVIDGPAKNAGSIATIVCQDGRLSIRRAAGNCRDHA